MPNCGKGVSGFVGERERVRQKWGPRKTPIREGKTRTFPKAERRRAGQNVSPVGLGRSEERIGLFGHSGGSGDTECSSVSYDKLYQSLRWVASGIFVLE